MKIKTYASVSGKILGFVQNSIIMMPNFDHTAKIQINYSKDFNYSLLQAGDDVVITGEIDLCNPRQITINPTRIERQVKTQYRDVNRVYVIARAKTVEYSTSKTDLFHACFESGLLRTTNISFYIDRNKLNIEELRDFAHDNQLRPYCISGCLKSELNKMFLVAGSITRA